MSKQLSALEIANELENRFYDIYPAQQAVSMIRYLHTENCSLKGQIEDLQFELIKAQDL